MRRATSRLVPAALCAAALFSTACEDNLRTSVDAGTGDTGMDASTAAVVTPRFDPTQTVANGVEAEIWLRMPFPADHRRLPSGNVDLGDFPNPGDYTQLNEWLRDAEDAIDGFSTQGLAYLAFDGEIDTSNFPTTGEGFTSATSPVYLVDVDPDSPDYGTRHPVRWKYWPLDGLPDGYYLAQDTLGIGPAWGFPLRESTTYAVVVTTSVLDTEGRPVVQPPLVGAMLANTANVPAVTPAVTQGEYDAISATWAPLRAYLAGEAIALDTIAVATVFTTQAITPPLDAIADQIQAAPAPSFSAGFLTQSNNLKYRTETHQWNSTDTVTYAVYEGTYVAPNYQEGAIPYQNEGGALHFVGGVPTKVSDETINFVLTVPNTPPDSTLGCYPIALYAHGTGGSRNSFRFDDTAGRLAARGIAGISIDQPMHGVRNAGLTFDVDLMTFNFYNSHSFRSNFRQGAIDLVSNAKFVRESLAIAMADSHLGAAISFCNDRVTYMGHSQGGLTGALGIPFLPDVDGFVLSGAGGGMGITIVNRKDIIDFESVLRASFEVPDEEQFGEEHPLITLVQLHADISDPVNYARYWNEDTRYRSPASVMSTSGEHDAATPYRTGTALALGGYMPITTPVVIPVPEFSWLGLAPATAPFSANRNGKTMGFLQFTDDIATSSMEDTHFLIFYRPEAIDSSMHFLSTQSFTGVAELRRDANADAR